MHRVSVLVLAVAALASACQSSPQQSDHFDEEGNRAPALVRGKIYPDELGYGLALLIEKPEKSVCTGVFVKTDNRRTFLTAAHCLRDHQQGDTLKIARTVLDQDGQPKLQVIGRLKAKLAQEQYAFNPSSPISPYDIAVGIAESDFPDDMTPLPLVEPDWLPATANAPFMFVGAGYTQEHMGADGAEIKRKATEYLDKQVQVRAGEYHSEVRVDRRSALHSLRDYVSTSPLEVGDQLVMAARDNRDPYVCPGDSGGPLVDVRANGEKRVAGVFSSAGLKVTSGGYYCWWFPLVAIPVSPHLGWIQQTVKKLAK